MRDHGHNYIVETSVRGKPDPRTGMVLNLSLLADYVNEEIFAHVDHRHLNRDVPFLKDVIPTAENMALIFWQRMEKRLERLEGVTLYRIRLYETRDCWVDCYGDAS